MTHIAESPCNLCQNRKTWIIGEKDRHGKPLRTVLCQNCGLAWTDPQPTKERIKAFYEDEYRTQYKGAWEPRAKHAFRAAGVASNRYRQLNRFMKPEGSILDIGSGGGEFVYLLHKLGINVRGIEPNRGYGEYARDTLGLPVEVSFVDGDLTQKGSFDMVTMFHVLEHLQDPSEKVAEIAKALNPQGVLVIEVPNLDSTCHAPNNCWHFAHLYHFSPKTLELLGKKNGLRCIHSEVSDYGGNVTAILQKAGDAPSEEISATSNAQRIHDSLTQHSFLRYLCKPATYSRFAKKHIGQVLERTAVKNSPSAQAALDLRLKREKVLL